MILLQRFGNDRAEKFKKLRDFNSGYREVTIKNAPTDFVSFENGESTDIKGYFVDLNNLKTKLLFGNGTITDNTVTFGKDDVLVYDKNGKVYYAKGYEYDGKVYYNATISSVE